MKNLIALTGKYGDLGHVIRVDDDIFDEMTKYTWHGQNVGGYNLYAKHGFRDEHKKKIACFAHRYAAFLYGILDHWLKTVDSREIDHIDHDGLNNTSKNLRAVSRSENQQNRRKKKSTSKYKGVCWHKRGKIWQSRITHDKKTILLGLFTNEMEAAKAYDKKAREFGYLESTLNFPWGLRGLCFNQH